MNKFSEKNGYTIAMGIFVLIGLMYIFQKDYATAAMNMSIGLAMGGSGYKSWAEVSTPMKGVVILLTVSSIFLFGWVIFTDFSQK